MFEDQKVIISVVMQCGVLPRPARKNGHGLRILLKSHFIGASWLKGEREAREGERQAAPAHIGGRRWKDSGTVLIGEYQSADAQSLGIGQGQDSIAHAQAKGAHPHKAKQDVYFQGKRWFSNKTKLN